MRSLFFNILGFIICSVTSSCYLGWTELKDQTLETAIINEPYSHNLKTAHHNWGVGWRDDHFLKQTSGDIPDGLGVTSGGNIVGTPLAKGEFKFRVSVFSFEEGLFEEDEVETEDSAWFILFVTEASTNADCPLPSNVDVTELHLCLGTLTKTAVKIDEEVELDVNYYINLSQADSANHDVNQIAMTITYDATSFSLDDAKLNSQLLQEAATRTAATVTFVNNPGELKVEMTAVDKPFLRPGRLMNIPFKAIKDLDQASYAFTLTNPIYTPSDPDMILPATVAVDGSLTVEVPATVPATPTETTEE